MSNGKGRNGMRVFGIATMLACTVAATSFSAGAGTALAPEPVRLTQELSGSTGAMGVGYYTYSRTQASVLRWPGSWAPGSVAAGTPCSTVNLAAGETATQTIQATGSYRRCI